MRAHSAAGAIRQAISAGEFTPGEKLIETEMSERFGISRNTLRESFAMLIADGVLTRIPFRGVFISAPTADDVRDLYLARGAIEPGAVRWGAHHDIARLEAIVAEAEQALGEGRLSDAATANQRFHRELVAGAGSRLLDETMDRVLAQMRLAFLRVLAQQPDFHAAYVPVNRRVLDLLRQGEREEAARVLQASLAGTSERLEELFAATAPDTADLWHR
ncbi:GntR family transcriptional regulator [Corynebacterium halotolerans]|uniref:GntR family transcriptional regulator n=1 Tax=Corynebacterium halotolerans YIM 70093 = DSM 44683 TaxID=1121362 RepID=M1P5K4_9CORY|nr:GntR family transcriptional regulator [Corynebacterium halotolerans]AGF71931.1 GntR family transcriptional regulator [Corynebacterium halotolerans YIM 70093 = DSM 44683]